MKKMAVLVVMVSAVLIGCSDSKPKETYEKTCVEPENPYDEGTGHYAGYKWAEENGGDCNGNSNSFNEGCEEYHSQEDEYEDCEAKSK
jgi:hypothetical protein